MVPEHLGFMISDSQLQLASWRWLALTTSGYEKAAAFSIAQNNQPRVV